MTLEDRPNQSGHIPANHREQVRTPGVAGREVIIVSFPGHMSTRGGPQSQPREGIRFDISSARSS